MVKMFSYYEMFMCKGMVLKKKITDVYKRQTIGMKAKDAVILCEEGKDQTI